mgnify:FL=1
MNTTTGEDIMMMTIIIIIIISISIILMMISTVIKGAHINLMANSDIIMISAFSTAINGEMIHVVMISYMLVAIRYVLIISCRVYT